MCDEMRNKGLELEVKPKQGNDGNYQCWIKETR